MPSFYFEQLLQNGLNGIDQRGITAAVLQIAGVVLILSLLWAVYEAYASGGDVRHLGIAAIKYLVLGLVFLNYQSAFRAVNGMFNGVADGIYHLSGGRDAVQSWLNSLSQAWSTNPNWFSALWNWATGGISAIVAGLITLVGYLILPFTYTLFTLFYALYGSILYDKTACCAHTPIALCSWRSCLRLLRSARSGSPSMSASSPPQSSASTRMGMPWSWAVAQGKTGPRRWRWCCRRKLRAQMGSPPRVVPLVLPRSRIHQRPKGSQTISAWRRETV